MGGFTAGIAMGQRVAKQWDYSADKTPYAIMPHLKVDIPRPARIRYRAATKAIAEKEQELREREMKLREAMISQQLRESRERSRLGRSLALRRADLEEQRTWADIEAKRAATEREGKITSLREKEIGIRERGQGLKEKEFQAKELERQKQEDYALAKWGLATNNPEPILNFFKKYGKEGVEIERIEFGPDGVDMQVWYKGHKQPEYFKDKEQFFSHLLAFANPKLEAKLQETAVKEAAKAKKGKTGASIYKVTMAQALKEWERRFLDPTGRPKPGAPDKDQWARQYVTEMARAGMQPEKRGMGMEYKDIPLRDGRIKRVWQDGTMEILTKDGVVQSVRTRNGIVYPAGTPGFKRHHKTRRYIGGY